MKFLFAMRYGNLAGTERATLELIRGLRRRGHDCTMVFTAPIKAIGPVLAAEQITYVQLDRGGASAYRNLRRLVAASRPDVFVQVGHRFVTTLAGLRLPIRKKLFMCHHHHIGEKTQLDWRANYAVIRRVFSSSIFVSEWLRSEAVGISPAIAERSYIVYPPVELRPVTTGTMRHQARQQLGLPQNSKIIGNAGRLMPVKRFDVFLKVAERVAAQLPDAHFVIAGQGSEHERLAALANALGLDQRLTWLPWQADMEPFYRSLDVLLFNTDLEAFGLVPCEAAAHGIPAVCSVINGGVPEIMPGHGIYCFGTHDETRLAEAVIALCIRPRPEDVEKFRQAIQHHCSPEQILDNFLKVVEG